MSKKREDIHEIDPSEMPAFLNDVAAKYFREDEYTFWKLAQCSFWIMLCNEKMLIKENKK